MRMVFPVLAYKEKAIAFINEFYEHDSEIHGSGGLDRFLCDSTYELWLEKVLQDVDVANIPASRFPAFTYFYVREEDDEIVGMVNIRLISNPCLVRDCGHIGYCVRPSERRKSYATAMLREALKVCELVGIRDVVLVCAKSNVASASVIKNCGGIYEKELFSHSMGEIVDKYVIR